MRTIRTSKCGYCGGKKKHVLSGSWMARIRLKAKIGLREMARNLGYSATYIYEIEKGMKPCTEYIRQRYEALIPEKQHPKNAA